MEKRQDIKAGLVLAIGVSGAIWIVVAILFVQALTHDLQNRLFEQEVVGPANRALEAQRTAEMEEIVRYRWIDKANGVVAIPIGRAMTLYAERYASKGPAGGAALDGDSKTEVMP